MEWVGRGEYTVRNVGRYGMGWPVRRGGYTVRNLSRNKMGWEWGIYY